MLEQAGDCPQGIKVSTLRLPFMNTYCDMWHAPKENKHEVTETEVIFDGGVHVHNDVQSINSQTSNTETIVTYRYI